MAKVSRSVLKEIVKECLVEILSEGLLNTEQQLSEASTKKRKRRSNKISPDVFQKRNAMLREKTTRSTPEVNALTEDPMMREIFADTAATTFQSQPLGESKKTAYVPGDAAAKVVYENDLDDLFEGSENWAALAFNDGKT